MSRFARLFRITLVVIGLSALAYSIVRMREAKGAYIDTLGAIEICQKRASEIAILRQRPDRAARQSRSQLAFSKTIEEAAVASGLNASQIVSIEPQAPHRVDETFYEEHAAQLRLEGVRLPELAKLSALFSTKGLEDSPLQVSALRITAPYHVANSDEAKEVWNVELTLTYLVYSPKNPASK